MMVAKWRIDPHPSQVNDLWDVWVWEKSPLSRLQWDLGGLFRKELDVTKGCYIHFFNYTVKIGRAILRDARHKEPVALTHWLQQGLSRQYLSTTWRRLWAIKQEQKVALLQWKWTAHHRALAWCNQFGAGYFVYLLIHLIMGEVWKRNAFGIFLLVLCYGICGLPGAI